MPRIVLDTGIHGETGLKMAGEEGRSGKGAFGGMGTFCIMTVVVT